MTKGDDGDDGIAAGWLAKVEIEDQVFKWRIAACDDFRISVQLNNNLRERKTK